MTFDLAELAVAVTVGVGAFKIIEIIAKWVAGLLGFKLKERQDIDRRFTQEREDRDQRFKTEREAVDTELNAVMANIKFFEEKSRERDEAHREALHKEVKELQKEFHDIALALAKNHPTKEDLKELRDGLRDDFNASIQLLASFRQAIDPTPPQPRRRRTP